MFENRTIARPVFGSKCDSTPSQTCGRKLKKPSQFSEISLCDGKDSEDLAHLAIPSHPISLDIQLDCPCRINTILFKKSLDS